MASEHLPKKKRDIWLVGHTLTTINGCELPSNLQVLQRFFHLHREESQTITGSARATVKEVIHFWEKARIPTRREHHIIRKLKDMHTRWVNLKKNASRKTDTQKWKEYEFIRFLNGLFDIAHADALTLINLQEDREFLLAQREKGRRGSMGPVDMVLEKREQRCHKQASIAESRRVRQAKRMLTESAAVEASGSRGNSN